MHGGCLMLRFWCCGVDSRIWVREAGVNVSVVIEPITQQTLTQQHFIPK